MNDRTHNIWERKGGTLCLLLILGGSVLSGTVARGLLFAVRTLVSVTGLVLVLACEKRDWSVTNDSDFIITDHQQVMLEWVWLLLKQLAGPQCQHKRHHKEHESEDNGRMNLYLKIKWIIFFLNEVILLRTDKSKHQLPIDLDQFHLVQNGRKF